MNQFNENRREFLKRASIVAAAFPLFINCESDTLAQKNNESILSLIKKNANTSPAANWCGATDALDDVSWKTALLPLKSELSEKAVSIRFSNLKKARTEFCAARATFNFGKLKENASEGK